MRDIEWKWDLGLGDRKDNNNFDRYMMRCILVWHAENLNDSIGNWFFGVDVPSRNVLVVRILRHMIFRCEPTSAHLFTHTHTNTCVCVTACDCVCMLALLWMKCLKSTHKRVVEWCLLASWLFENIIYSMVVCINMLIKYLPSNTFPIPISIEKNSLSVRFPDQVNKTPDWISFPSQIYNAHCAQWNEKSFYTNRIASQMFKKPWDDYSDI